jgi:hypothetical protein
MICSSRIPERHHYVGIGEIIVERQVILAGFDRQRMACTYNADIPFTKQLQSNERRCRRRRAPEKYVEFTALQLSKAGFANSAYFDARPRCVQTHSAHKVGQNRHHCVVARTNAKRLR